MTIYTFEVAGHVDQRWEMIFEHFRLAHAYGADGRPITLLTGPVTDQAALYGMVSRLRDLGATLISVAPGEPGGESGRPSGRPGSEG